MRSDPMGESIRATEAAAKTVAPATIALKITVYRIAIQAFSVKQKVRA